MILNQNFTNLKIGSEVVIIKLGLVHDLSQAKNIEMTTVTKIKANGNIQTALGMEFKADGQEVGTFKWGSPSKLSIPTESIRVYIKKKSLIREILKTNFEHLPLDQLEEIQKVLQS